VAFFVVWMAPHSAEAYITNGATLEVTNCANGTDLQNAINAAPPGAIITFACGTPSNPATIPITSSILGNNQSFTLEGNGSVILAGMGSPGSVLDLADTPATVRDITLTGGTGTGTGGAIKVDNAPVTVINATIYNNAAVGVGRGGGIYVSGATLTVINSTFSGNSATQVGNDLETDGAVINLENSIFLDGCFDNGGTIVDGGGNIDTGNSCIANNTNGSLANAGSTILGALVHNLFFPLPSGSVEPRHYELSFTRRTGQHSRQHLQLRSGSGQYPTGSARHDSRSQLVLAGSCGAVDLLVGLFDVAVAHAYHAMPITGGFGIVRDHQDGLTQPMVQVAEQGQHGVRVFSIQIAGGFIGQQDSRLIDDGACNGDTLLLAAGKRAGLVIQAALDAEQLQDVEELRRERSISMSDIPRDLDIAARGEGGEEIVFLENESHRGLAELGAFGVGHAEQVASGDPNGPGGGMS
jgi:hypothetical protein